MGGYWADVATATRSEWSKKLSLKAAATLTDLLAAAQRAMDGKKFSDAIRYYHSVVRKAEPGVDDKVLGDAWYKLGECYFRQVGAIPCVDALAEAPAPAAREANSSKAR